MPLSLPGAAPLTAQGIVQRIQTELGGEWPSTGPDGFKAGDPAAVVKGIATTAMATLDVPKQAVKANTNLVLTYEPTFYSRTDGRVESTPGRGAGGTGADDPVAKAKQEFIQKRTGRAGETIERRPRVSLCRRPESQGEQDPGGPGICDPAHDS